MRSLLILLALAGLLPYPIFDVTTFMLLGIPYFIFSLIIVLLLFNRRSREEIRSSLENNKTPWVYILSLGVFIWLPALVIYDFVPWLSNQGGNFYLTLYLHRLVFGIILFILSYATGKLLLPVVSKKPYVLILLFILSVLLACSVIPVLYLTGKSISL